MAGDDLQAIISVVLDDQATGPLQAIPAAVEETVAKINSTLQGLGQQNPFNKLAGEGEGAALTLESLASAAAAARAQLKLAAESARELSASSGGPVRIEGLEGAQRIRAELEQQIRLRRELALASGTASSVRVTPGGQLQDVETKGRISSAEAQRRLELEQQQLVAAQELGQALGSQITAGTVINRNLERQVQLSREAAAAVRSEAESKTAGANSLEKNQDLGRKLLRGNPNVSDEGVASFANLSIAQVQELRAAEIALNGTLEQQQAELDRIVKLRERLNRDPLASFTTPATEPGGAPQIDVAKARREAAALEASAASTRVAIKDGTFEGGSAKEAAQQAALEAAQAAEINKALGLSKAEVTVASRELTSAERLEAEARTVLAGETVKVQVANGRLAVSELQVAAAMQSGDPAKALGALIKQINATEALAKAQKEASAAPAAAAGGGGFFGGVREGLVGKGDFTLESAGKQLGEVAKYIYLYEAFIKVSEGIKTSIELTKEYENGLISLQVALASVGQQGAVSASQLTAIGAQANFTPGQSLQAGARGIQAFRDESTQSGPAAAAVATQSLDAAQQGAVLSGQKLDEVQNQIIATTKAFELGAGGQARVLDAATNANINFGASVKDVLEGLSQVAGIAKESGFSVEQLGNAIGLITSTTGLTGASAAGDLKRILGGAGAPAFQKALADTGIDTNQSTEKEIEALGQKYRSLTEAQRENIITTLGGRRSAEALIPLLAEVGQFQAANQVSTDNAGAAAKQYEQRQDSLAGTLRKLGGEAKSLLVDLGQSGLGAVFGLLLQVSVPVVRVLDDAVKLFDRISPSARNGAFAFLELAAAVRVLQNLGIGGVGSKVASIATFGKLGGGAAAGVAETEAAAAPIGAASTVVAAEIETGGALIAAAMRTAALEVSGGGAVAGVEEAGPLAIGAARKARFAVGATGVAEEVGGGAAAAAGVGGVGAALGSLAATAGIAAGAFVLLDGAIAVNKAADLANELGRAKTVIDDIGRAKSDTDSLRSSAATAAGEAAKIREQSSGFNGTIAAFLDKLGGRDPKTSANELADLAKSLRDQATLQEKASAPVAGSTSVFGPEGPQSVTALDAKIKELTANGSTAAQIVAILGGAIQELGKKGSEATANVGKVTTGQGGDIFAGKTVLGLPTSVDEQRTRTQFAGRGVPVQSGVETFSADIALSLKQRDELARKIQDDLAAVGKNKPNAVLNEADFKRIGDDYGRALKAAFPDLSPAALKTARDEALRKLRSDTVAASAPQDVKAVLVDAFRQDIAAQAGSISEANARGANSAELLKINQRNAAQLSTDAAQFQKTGNPVPPDLEQKLAESAKAAFDAFATRTTELQRVAKTLAGNDQKAKAAIDRQTAQVLSAAEGIDPRFLPTSFNTLSGAMAGTTNGALKTAESTAAGARQVLAQAKADANALLQEAAKLQAEADAAYAAIGREDGIAARLTTGSSDARARAAGVTSAAAAAVRQIQTPRVNDPSFVPNIDQITADAGKEQAAKQAKQQDTAEQIAAARRLAAVAPGDTVGTAAAEVAVAAANLHAQTKQDVSYFNALRSLRQAQVAYTQAVAQLADSRDAAGTFPGAPVEQAATSVRSAARELAVQTQGSVGFYGALRTLRQAQFDYGQAVLEAQHVGRELGEDLTNPVVQAQEALRTARAKLASDQRAGAPKDVTNADKLAVQQASNSLEATAFQQRLDAAKTNLDLGRISENAYITFLDHQRDSLQRIAHRTFQQQQELNQVDQLLKDVANSFQGQFNLGDIKLPSVFQVRSQIANGNTTAVQNVQINITGGDLTAVKSVIGQYLGAGAFARTSVSTTKV